LAISPSQRISNEFIRRSKAAYGRIANAPALIGDAVGRLEMPNRSRLLALPGDNDGDTIRGLANVRLVLVDEASRCSDDLIAAVRPMLANNPRAQLIFASTPAGKRGAFYETMTGTGDDWKRIVVKMASTPRTSTPARMAFYARERKNLGDTKFREEYGCEFLDDNAAAFSADIIDAIIDPELRAFRW
jgi:hypothetical protein